MSPQSIENMTDLAAIVIVAVVVVISVGMTARTRMRTDAARRADADGRADAALKEAERVHQESVRKLAEAQQLAADLRAHRQWIEENPERFLAALRAQFTTTDQ
ncbi:hypothetical protein [Actinoallomurus sp. CA-142502]|uniref:hypothetical protein n=1 Tax=Actinoallomurus sp. CA-142502 TaxID=3239885 RepID=UPI003D8AC564